MGLAVRYGAVTVNPVREAARVRGGRRRTPRALTAAERERWLVALETDRRAVVRDLPDLTRWMLATGLRIGEALAVAWSDVDLDAGTVEVDWKLIRITRRGPAAGPPVEGKRRSHAAATAVRGHHAEAAPAPPRRAWTAVPEHDRRLARPEQHLPCVPGGEGRSRVLVGYVTRVPEDLCDDLGRGRPLGPSDRGPARPRAAVDDQDVYMARKVLNPATAAALEAAAGPGKEATADA